jgi:hypothetical protein
MEPARAGAKRKRRNSDRASVRIGGKPAAPCNARRNSARFRSSGRRIHRRERWRPGGAATTAAPQKRLGLSSTSVARALNGADLQTEMTKRTHFGRRPYPSRLRARPLSGDATAWAPRRAKCAGGWRQRQIVCDTVLLDAVSTAPGSDIAPVGTI